MEIILIHRAFEKNAIIVAQKNFIENTHDIDALNKLFHMTQKGLRSTSIGDLAVVEDQKGIRFYQCASQSWNKIKILNFVQIMSIPSEKELVDYRHNLYMEEEDGITLKGRSNV